MERKIGEIFEHEGEWYQCVESDSCGECSLFTTECGSGTKSDLADKIFGECSRVRRSDNKHAIFKKLEKVGEPYPLYGHIVQRYAGVKFPVALTEKRFINCNEINNTIDIEVKQQNQNTEDMEANEKTITIPEGWEFDRIDESGNIVLKEKKKELPKTWLKCLYSIDDVEMIEEDSEINKCNINDQSYDGRLFDDSDHNLLPLGLGKPMLALCQLLVCRNAWWKQLWWKPDWDDKTAIKHCIHLGDNNHTDITQHSSFSRILAFPTEDTAIRFRNTFRDLIEEAKELL